nr:nucleolar protein 58-like [Ipomoea batatas]
MIRNQSFAKTEPNAFASDVVTKSFELESQLKAQSKALWALKYDLKKHVSTELREMLECNDYVFTGLELDLRDQWYVIIDINEVFLAVSCRTRIRVLSPNETEALSIREEMVGGGNRKDDGSFVVTNSNVFAALDSLRKKKKSDKEKGSSKKKTTAEAAKESQIIWSPTPLKVKSWADVDDDDDYFATT